MWRSIASRKRHLIDGAIWRDVLNRLVILTSHCLCVRAEFPSTYTAAIERQKYQAELPSVVSVAFLGKENRGAAGGRRRL
jgi:hypothetical protein